jgi:hypothetical protein
VATTEANYLRDLGRLIRDEALLAKMAAGAAIGDQRSFESGRLMAYYEVLSLMTQQGVAFGLSPESFSSESFDPDSLLV